MSVEISLRDAAKANIKLLRSKRWALLLDHIEITIHDGVLGPWVMLYSELNINVNGRNPVKILITQFDLDKKEWVPWVE